MGWFLFLCAVVFIFFIAYKYNNLRIENEKAVAKFKQDLQESRNKTSQLLKENKDKYEAEISFLNNQINYLEVYKAIPNAEEEAEKIVKNAKIEGDAIIKKAMDRKNEIDKQIEQERESLNNTKKAYLAEVSLFKAQAKKEVEEKRERIDALFSISNAQAEKIISDAQASAENIAGDAYRALKNVDALKSAATAMKNVIDGYGHRYLKPTYSLLDELAQTYGFDEAGKQLKLARERTASMVEHRRAATSEYVEHHRLKTAIEFIVDAFNGKVDSILSKSKKDNYGTLEQQIKDAFALVNHNGAAFRNTKIKPEYLAARLEELRWAAAVMAVREREREEQRAIREQIREEERARREIERALKDAAKEEEAIARAMEKMRQQIERAKDDQRQKYEAELELMQQRLQEAEARNQRALSMAQQTKAGHVYIISNIGSFGENVFKVGMTRRLEPLDRVRELGDASVPFAFDVHAMMWSEDAPALERALHIEFARAQVNKVNPRKEFFRVGLAELRTAVEGRGIEASWTMAADAAEYRETLAIEQGMAQSDALAQDWLRKQTDFETREVVAFSDDEG